MEVARVNQRINDIENNRPGTLINLKDLEDMGAIQNLNFVLNITTVFILSKAQHDPFVFYKACIYSLHTSVARLHETAGHRDSVQVNRTYPHIYNLLKPQDCIG